MQKLTSFVIEVLLLTLLQIAFDSLLPSGRIKHTAATAARLTFVAALLNAIIGIFAELGV